MYLADCEEDVFLCLLALIHSLLEVINLGLQLLPLFTTHCHFIQVRNLQGKRKGRGERGEGGGKEEERRKEGRRGEREEGDVGRKRRGGREREEMRGKRRD